MSLTTITETLALTLIAKRSSPQPRRVLTPEGMVQLNEWLETAAAEPQRQDLRLWVLSASQAALAVNPRRAAVEVVMPSTMSKSGKAETLSMSRHLFFWQVDAG